MRRFIHIITESPVIEQDKFSAFAELADEQRGEPEMAMLRAQHVLGGGVMNFMVEHIGDITHRMAEHPDLIPCCGYEFVRPKVDRGLRMLKSGYGFVKEFRENIASNARHRGVDPSELMEKINRVLLEYATAHSRLSVYNIAQDTAKHAAVTLGRQDFGACERALETLSGYLKTPEEWQEIAGQYDPNYQSVF